MNLINLTPKDKELYSIAMERKETLLNYLDMNLSKQELSDMEEIIHHISRAEYKRGKADGIAETKKDYLDSLIRSPTEILSLEVGDLFEKNGDTWVNIPDEISKVKGRLFNLMYCGEDLKKYIKRKDLKPEDKLFDFSPGNFNSKMKKVAKQIWGDSVSHPKAGGKFSEITLYSLRHSGSILVYNQGFEKGVMNECSDALPEFREWYDNNIFGRVKDLWDVFKDFAYYDPAQKGSTSIKYVLPVLTDLKYDDLDIGNGMLASLEYERVTYGDVDDSERLKVREALEKYCELDTLAEVEIIKTLNKVKNKE